MELLFVALGVALIFLGWYDVFHTLLHPRGRGRLSRGTISLLWRASKKMPQWARTAVGPLGIVMVVALWALIQIFGWALVYYPWMPDGFSFSPGLVPSSYAPIAESIAFSAVTLSTVGYGDVVPSEGWLRLVAPIESLAGFALLTAAVSWLQQLYPTLARQRTLALRLTLLDEAGVIDKLHSHDPATASLLLDSLAAEVARTRVDYLQNAEAYYFPQPDRRTSLASSLALACLVARKGGQSQDQGVRLSSAMLQTSLDDLATYFRNQFMPAGGTTDDVFDRYAKDHGRKN